jgi:hypothetical protein
VRCLLFLARLLEEPRPSAQLGLLSRAQGRRESINADIERRVLVYTDFITECSKLLIDAADHTLDSPTTLIHAYALLNRIRLMSSDAVVGTAEQTLDEIIDQYSQPNLTIEEVRMNLDRKRRVDPLKSFSESCRNELRQLKPVA